MSGDNNNTERERKVRSIQQSRQDYSRDCKGTKTLVKRYQPYSKKHGVNHGIISIDDDNNKKSHSNNEKATLSYKLFSEGNKPVEVAIQLGLSERQATRYYTEYWRLKRIYKLHFIYKQSKGDLSTFLRLYRLSKRLGIRIKDLG